MARIKSAIKRHRQSLKRRDRNKEVKSKMKTAIKKFLMAIDNKKLEEARNLFKSVQKIINKTASKGIIHKRNASRRISRLAKKLNEINVAV